ncbi:MAG: cysteine--tRNA ligase [Thermovirga sp.]|nr:cysteine--tRNA ligase [Thermovirga sp.]
MEVFLLETIMIYNDLTRKKEPFIPQKEGKVGIYTCGPTVYDYFHIGNARPFIVFDAFRRFLETQGYEVTFVQNFTDIDDKMIKRAKELNITVPQLAERYIKAYYEDADALGIKRPTVAPRATEHIEDIIALIEKIIKNNHAYVANGDVYFDVQSFPEYGKLSKQSLEELQSGARIEINPNKKHPLDFALWKAKKPGEPSWPSPWGEGRPGWHIECSAMAIKYLGETIDIHAGGSDLIFPHHENEIAQAEAATGKPFVKYWMHNGYLMINAEKMSKSLGNFLTAREARKKFHPAAIRLFMLSAHYRTPLNFSVENLINAAKGAERIRNCWNELVQAEALSENLGNLSEETKAINYLQEKFDANLKDDFNTAGAIGVLFEAVKSINQALTQERKLDKNFIESAKAFMEYADNILGIIDISDTLKMEGDTNELDEDLINALVKEREEARKKKDFSKADEIRDKLSSMGIILEDTPSGTRWKRALL